MFARAAAALAAVLVLAACSSSGSGPLPSSHGGTSDTAPGVTSTEVSFDDDGTMTYGTLDVPAHRSGQRLPAALLIPGSGPTDRDGNQAGGEHPDTLKLVARILEAQGIATFRFDKYFTGRTGPGKLGADLSAITIDSDLTQTRAAYDFLRAQSAVDPSKLLVVGHSEGGMLALNIAANASVKPAGLALLEPQDLRALTLVQVQYDEAIAGLVQAETLTADEGTTNRAAVAQAIAAVRAGQTVDTSGMAPVVVKLISPLLIDSATPKYQRTWDLIMPVALAAKVQRGTYLLFTDGTRDTKVPQGTTGPLRRALHTAGTTGPGFTLIDGTDHDMHLASQPDTEAVLAPAIVTAITGWAHHFSPTH